MRFFGLAAERGRERVDRMRLARWMKSNLRWIAMRGVLTLTSEGSNGDSSCLEVRFGFLVEQVDGSVDEFACVSKVTNCFSITAGSAGATNER